MLNICADRITVAKTREVVNLSLRPPNGRAAEHFHHTSKLQTEVKISGGINESKSG